MCESYPASHGDALAGVLRVVDLIAARPDSYDDEIVEALVRDGAGEVDAELLVRFVPMAFSFALLKLMGVSKFPSMFRVYDVRGVLVDMPLATEHYFTAALWLGHEVTTRGYTDRISKEVFQSITVRSAEINAVNQALEAGLTLGELAHGTVGSPILLGVTSDQIGATRRTPDRAGPAKPWWRFWGRRHDA
jgi:hypothetical protein